MDIQLEKKKGIQKKHIPYIAGGAVVILLLIWIIFGNHASTLRVDAASLNIADVTFGKFNDYIRLNGQVQPISVVQLSPEEGGIVQEKVVEEGAHVKKGDVIGTATLSYANQELTTINLVAAESMEKSQLLQIGSVMKDIFSSLWFIIIASIIGVLLIVYITLTLLYKSKKKKMRKVKKYRKM